MKRAKDFIRKVQSSSDLQATLSDASWSITSVVAAGAAEGFEFTGEEYRTAYGELAREELASVVGGVSAAWKKARDIDEAQVDEAQVGEAL